MAKIKNKFSHGWNEQTPKDETSSVNGVSGGGSSRRRHRRRRRGGVGH